MQETTGGEIKDNEAETDAAGADSAATSNETLKDLEKSQDNIPSSSSEPEPGPSPDGAFDESGEINDAGPM